MRILAVFVATALAVVWATPALASVGLPRLGELRAGPHEIVLYNDSPTLVAGRNTLSLELPAGVDHDGVRLVLRGPAEQALLVHLRPVAVLGASAGHADAAEGDHAAEAPAVPAPAGSHNAHAPAAPTAAPAAPGHANGGADHAAAASPGAATAGGHEAAVAEAEAGTVLRGVVTVPSVGRWQASLTVADHADAVHTAEITLDAVRGGPNRLYLLATGSLMGGALIVGLAGRHRGVRRSLARSSQSSRTER